MTLVCVAGIMSAHTHALAQSDAAIKESPTFNPSFTVTDQDSSAKTPVSKGSDQTGPVMEDLDNPIRFEFRLAAWRPSLGGKITFGNSPSDTVVKAEGEYNLENDQISFQGDFTVHFKDRWLVWVNGIDFNTDASVVTDRQFQVNGSVVPVGSNMNNDFALNSVSMVAGYDFFGDLLHRNGEKYHKGDKGIFADMHVYALGGARVTNIDHRLMVGGGPNLEYNGSALTLEGGVKAAFGLNQLWADAGRFEVSTTFLSGFGGLSNSGGSTFDIIFAIDYMATDNFGLTFGYRQFDFSMNDDSASQPYSFDGRLAGLFFGGNIRF